MIYLSSGTRPDIIFTVTKLAKYAHAPGENHYKALVGYIQHAHNKAIKFYKDFPSSPSGRTLHESNIKLNNKLTVTFTDS